MEISSTSFRHLLLNISKAVSQKELAMDYDNLLREIFEERGSYDKALVDSEIQSKLGGEHLPSEEAFGRDHEKKMLLSNLIDQDKKRIQLSVIPILGGCGIGKTTLARLVYEDEVVKEHFELQVWVKVDGQKFNLQHAAREILKSTLGMSCSLDDLDELDEMVRDTLQSERCLIVFDGIESMPKDSWLHMNQCWFDYVDLGSTVLITTPSEDVADLVANQPFELMQLSPDDGLSMCRYLAFDSSELGVKDMSRLLAKNIAALCRGIPLLLKLVGSLMRYDVRLRNLLSSVDFSYGILLPPSNASVIILLCVWCLPPQLRQCLAYCAIFPKGLALSKEKIIDMWIADGLVKPSPGNISLHDIGDSYFRQLLCRSFFTDITHNQYDNIIEFRIPGLIDKIVEDVARIVYKEKLGLIRSIGEDAGQLSLVFPFAGKYKSEYLRTLILSPTLYLGGSLDHSLVEFKGMQSLDLSCSGIRNLSDDICALRELTYLNLSYTLIERLPDSITDLSLLQTLDLTGCYHLQVLPKGMRNLTHMIHLDLWLCDSLSYLPSGIGFLISLTLMPMFVLGEDHDCAHLGEIGLLNQLRGRLEIRNLENVREISEAQDAKLDQKNLHHLGLSWSHNAYPDCFKLLELLQPNPHLKVLDITGYMGFEFPRWISSINNLIKISITECGCKKLPSLGQLPFLKELLLKGLRNLKRIGPELYGDHIAGVFFRSLEQLELYDLPRLLNWSGTPSNFYLAMLFRSGTATVPSFHSLKTLTIEGCPQLPSLPILPTLPDLIVWNSNKNILSSLTSFTSLSSLLINDMELGVPFEDLGSLGSLKKLILCNIMDSRISGSIRFLAALEHLGVLHCHELTDLSLLDFSSLQKLHIVDCQKLCQIMVSKERDTPLIELVVEDCPRAISFIYFHKFRSLRKLILKNCGSDFTIYAAGKYERLEKLEYLFTSGCPRIERELQAFPSLVSHIPCIIVGNHKANYKDMKDLRDIHESKSPLADMLMPREISDSKVSRSRVRDAGLLASTEGRNSSVLEKRLSHGGHLEEFSLEVLLKATDNFSEELKIGTGSFGSVYHATLDDGRQVTIKRAKTSATSSYAGATKHGQEDKDSAFLNELEFLSRLNHKNLVRLLGYCKDCNELVLVYEYMVNGSLFYHLHELQSSPLMSWPTRIKVALDAGRGIEYLHEYAVPPVIHRDIKSSNILLDATWTAKVSDFGLSLMGPQDNESHLSLYATGTMGYVDPEYYRLNILTTKSDVYSFGIVLLELLSGCKAIHKNENGVPRNVVDYVVPYIVQDEINRVLDHRVPPPTPLEIEAVVYIGYLAADCVMSDGQGRPTMSDVVSSLERALAACLAPPVLSRSTSSSST